MYWFKIINYPGSLLHTMYCSHREWVHNVHQPSLAFQVKSILCDLGFSYLWNTDSVSRMQFNHCYIKAVFIYAYVTLPCRSRFDGSLRVFLLPNWKLSAGYVQMIGRHVGPVGTAEASEFF
jgi:hypothetical protein